MKLVVFLYLDEDETAVRALLKKHGITAFSELPVEGHGSGVPGWYGEVPTYASRMLFTIVSAQQATDLLAAVKECTDCRHPRHPIHALQVDIEAVANSPEGGGA